MRQLIKKTIDGEKYSFGCLPATTSLRILTKLSKMIASPIAGALGTGSLQEILERDLNIPLIVGMMADRMDEDEIIGIIKTLASQILHEPTGAIGECFDTFFSGRVAHLIKVIQASLEAEYSDFFGGNGVLAGLLKSRDIIPGQ